MKIDLASKFDRHHIRVSFYHGGIILFLLFSFLFYIDAVSGGVYNGFCITLIIIDYIAEMFDPHPDNMGTWFERYFHRAFEEFEDGNTQD